MIFGPCHQISIATYVMDVEAADVHEAVDVEAADVHEAVDMIAMDVVAAA
ncbi:MAG TPA: hypothetical protein VEL11_11135 [Candidatus Bathyarchaeia archaeon]|nr:hypothetical protein [Candidatus Bathyarchaeia archaeon]